MQCMNPRPTGVVRILNGSTVQGCPEEIAVHESGVRPPPMAVDSPIQAISVYWSTNRAAEQWDAHIRVDRLDTMRNVILCCRPFEMSCASSTNGRTERANSRSTWTNLMRAARNPQGSTPSFGRAPVVRLETGAHRARIRQPKNLTAWSISYTCLHLLAATCWYSAIERVAAAPPNRQHDTVRGLTYVDGSTTKLEQLIGDWDKHLQRRTDNQTLSRYGIAGTDLGCSFEHNGKLIFLFGDTIGPGGGDCVATSDCTDPTQGLHLDFYRNAQGKYLKVRPPGVQMGGFEVPAGGISCGGKIYLFCTTDHAPAHVMGRSVLVRFDDRKRQFVKVRDISVMPGKFINIAAHVAPKDSDSLPQADGQQILWWGSGAYRHSNPYLACVPVDRVEIPGSEQYFSGYRPHGTPIWKRDEASAQPLFEHPVIGELSVTWCASLRIWLLTYNSHKPRGIMLRWAHAPWGPWSEAITIFQPWRDGYGKFMHAAWPDHDDHLAGPIAVPGGDPQRIWGGEYGPYVIERFTEVKNTTLTIHYVMSTWNPYTVVLMRSQLRIVKDVPPTDRETAKEPTPPRSAARP